MKFLSSLLAASPSALRLGLDVGAKRTKVVGMSRKAGKLIVQHALDVPTPPGLISGGRVANPEDAARFLGRVLQDRKIKAREIAMVVGLSDAVVKRLEVPRQDREGVLRGLRTNTHLQMSDAGLANLAVDYHEIACDATGANTLTLLAASGRKDVVRGIQRMAQDAGLNPGLVSVPAVALANAWGLSHQERISEGARSVLVHGGHGGLLIVVLDGEVPIATHYSPLGMAYLAEQAKVANPGAEAHIIEQALVGDEPLAVQRDTFDRWFDRLGQEIRRAAGAVGGGYGASADDLGEVWLSGGFVRVPRLIERLQEDLGASVSIFDPLESLEISDAVRASGSLGPALALALGVAAESIVLSEERGS